MKASSYRERGLKSWVTRRAGATTAGAKQAVKALIGTQTASESRRSSGLAAKINSAADAVGRLQSKAVIRALGRRR